MPKGGFFDDIRIGGKRTVQIAYGIARDVCACVCHVIIAASLPEIDLKYLEFPISWIEFDVEIGKALIAGAFKESFHFFHELSLIFRQDRGMIAKSFRRVFFQKDMSETHHFYFCVPVGISGEDIHAGIIARDEILHDNRVVVAGGKDLLYDAFRLFWVIRFIDLFHAVERMLPVPDRACRLDDNRIGERKRGELFHVGNRPKNDGFRIIDSVFVAHLVKGVLGNQRFCELSVGARTKIVWGKRFSVFDDKVGICVGTAEEQQLFSGIFFGKFYERFQKNFGFAQFFNDGEIDDFAVLRGTEDVSAEGMGFYAIGFMKGAGYAVAVEVCTEQDRKNCVLYHGLGSSSRR